MCIKCITNALQFVDVCNYWSLVLFSLSLSLLPFQFSSTQNKTWEEDGKRPNNLLYTFLLLNVWILKWCAPFCVRILLLMHFLFVFSLHKQKKVILFIRHSSHCTSFDNWNNRLLGNREKEKAQAQQARELKRDIR